MTHTRTLVISAITLLPLLAGGCMTNPFGDDPLDKHTVATTQRLRSINSLVLEQRDYQEEVQPSKEQTLQDARDRFAGVERIELSLSDARIAALANNLNLGATLIAPTIAAEQVSEEEGRFEAIF
ncbi:MAG TPA: hypothetical protein DF699_07075, partial [Phycisphaerales bacterium]|nr:hypothetical protein [Phycisphaerales bacterium]